MKRLVASLSGTLMGLITTLSGSTLARELSIHPQLKRSSPIESPVIEQQLTPENIQNWLSSIDYDQCPVFIFLIRDSPFLSLSPENIQKTAMCVGAKHCV